MVCYQPRFSWHHTLISFEVNPKNGKPAGMISEETYQIVQKNAEVLDSAIIYDRDFNYNLYVGYIDMLKSYLSACL